jgi:hypothetical protein
MLHPLNAVSRCRTRAPITLHGSLWPRPIGIDVSLRGSTSEHARAWAL